MRLLDASGPGKCKDDDDNDDDGDDDDGDAVVMCTGSSNARSVIRATLLVLRHVTLADGAR